MENIEHRHTIVKYFIGVNIQAKWCYMKYLLKNYKEPVNVIIKHWVCEWLSSNVKFMIGIHESIAHVGPTW